MPNLFNAAVGYSVGRLADSTLKYERKKEVFS